MILDDLDDLKNSLQQYSREYEKSLTDDNRRTIKKALDCITCTIRRKKEK